MFQNGTCAIFFQFSTGIYVSDMFGHSRSAYIEYQCNLCLSQPYGFSLNPHFKLCYFVWLVNHDFAYVFLFHVNYVLLLMQFNLSDKLLSLRVLHQREPEPFLSCIYRGFHAVRPLGQVICLCFACSEIWNQPCWSFPKEVFSCRTDYILSIQHDSVDWSLDVLISGSL